MGSIGATYRSDDTGAVGSDQTGLVLCLQDVCDANHVCKVQLVFTHPLAKNRARHTVLRNTLSDTAKKVSD